jgi:hypothetical protein
MALAVVARRQARKVVTFDEPSNWSQGMPTKQIAILRAGPPTSRGPKAPDTTTPFVIEVETHEGPAVLQIGPQASAVLAKELAGYLKLHSK